MFAITSLILEKDLLLYILLLLKSFKKTYAAQELG